MPPIGFKSITMPKNVYDHFFKKYQEEKQDIAVKGIFSFSAYITYQLSKK